MAQQSDVLDSLPYYDDDLQKYPFLKDKVEQEITREMGKVPVELHPRVPPEVDLFPNNPLLRAEIARVEAKEQFPPLDALRYQLPAPTSTPATDDDWKAALDNARAQLEHQRIRQTNLTLLQTYGANAWRIHNYQLEQQAKNIDKTLDELKELTVEVNRDRKNTQACILRTLLYVWTITGWAVQEQFGKQLTALETRWTNLISSVLQIEMANVALEAELEGLQVKESELAEIA